TAKLPRIDIDIAPQKVVGTTTVDAIRSGILHGFGGMIDRMVDLLHKEMADTNEEFNIIATGGMARLIAPFTSSLTTIDPLLTLTGLRLIYNRNNK
ncbi:MAG: type III pantothenate kinase, partial [Desulfobulbus sp.]